MVVDWDGMGCFHRTLLWEFARIMLLSFSLIEYSMNQIVYSSGILLAPELMRQSLASVDRSPPFHLSSAFNFPSWCLKMRQLAPLAW